MPPARANGQVPELQAMGVDFWLKVLLMHVSAPQSWANSKVYFQDRRHEAYEVRWHVHM